MLDTVVLTLDSRHFEILQPERFSPSAKGLVASPYYRLGSRGNFACVQNPTKADLKAGRYLPRLTLSKRKISAGFALTLRIEFSALAYAGKGTVRLSKLLQQLGCTVLVDSVGIRGAGAALSRHCSPRSWQRYKRELKALPVRTAGAFRALQQVDLALSRFEAMRMKNFQGPATQDSVAESAR
jgi:hypothetical protein